MGIYENIVNKSKKKDEEENVFQRIVDLASSKENIPSKFSTSRTASENYDIQRQAFNIAQKNYNSALQSSYQKNRAFDFSLPDMRENNFLNSSKENRLIFPGTSDGKVNYFDTEENKKRISKSRDETSDLKKVVDVELNDLKYANYLKNAEKVNSEETTLWDKTGGVIGRALTDVVSSLGSDKYKYIDEQGNTVYLPTYGDLKQQKVREDYNSGVGRFLGDVFYNTTKIAGTSALNTVAPGVGTTLYWQDMFLDSYKNSLNEGHDNVKSIAYAIANTGLEYATGKFLGSATKGLTGGKTNELTNALSNVANRITKNPKVASLLGNMGSEATEEFLQEYLDNASRLLILGEDIDLMNSQIFEDALYSAAVGGLSGGLLSSSNRNESDMIKRRVDTYKEFKKALEETKNKTTDVKQLEQIDNLISKTNDYIKNPFINRDLTEQTINLQNQVNNLQSKTNEKTSFPKPAYQYQQTGINENEIAIDKYQNINEAMYDYANKIKDNFNTTINIETNKTKIPVDYSQQPQTTIFQKAKEVFSKIGKNIFQNNGDNIYVSNGDIKESIAKTVRNTEQKKLLAEHIEIFSNLDRIIENGTLIAKGNETKGRSEYKKWDYYATPIKINGDNYIVEFDTVLRDNGQKHFRLERIYNLEEAIKKQVAPTDKIESQSVNRFVEQPVSVNDNTTNLTESQIAPLPSNNSNMQNIKNNVSETSFPAQPNKDLNPLELSNLTPNSANTTPKLPKVNRNKENDGDSHFAVNIENKVGMLTPEQRQTILNDIEAGHYDTITNKDSLETAFNRLNENGEAETRRWFAKDSENATATDVAEGWILLKQYADNNQSDDMVAVAKKLRDMGTKAGQTVQAFNIMARMTPEGMIKYAQSELSEAYDRMVKNKSKKWVEQHQKDFDLTPQETGAIMDIMKKVSTMEDGYDKRVELAKIQKIMTDKLPPERGAGIKSWMRISMLFNPKTQVRNVTGNAVIAPVNYFSDLFASVADKAVGSKTGYRTTGVTNVKNYIKGFKEGAYQSYNDFRKGINTRNIQGNRFEISEGKSFNNNTPIGKALNRVDSLLSFMLDAGDRTFYEATFTNSINNQLVLNNTTKVTQEMIDIATQEALSRTWQDNNNYTRFVLNIRKGLNTIHIPGKEGYGLGDVLIPFAKTPANLTKAIVDYSPAGLVNTLVKGKNLKNAIETGQFTPQMQHEFVQSLGKATAGTMLYIAGYALAKAGIITGESDDDKDVSNFMKNTLGVNSYSIKIGDMSFAYDWAQPVAAPFSMMANLVQKQEESDNLLENVTAVLDTGLNVIFEQSFLTSINDVLSEPGEIGSKIGEQLLDLPARAVPTFMKQIVDLTDDTQRTTFEYGKPIQSMINSVKAKIPGLSKTLVPVVDTMGREVKRHGGKNNIFNVFFNPANVSTENISESAKEIYRLYKETGVTTIMPRVAPYYINKEGKKTNLSSSERAEYQKTSGDIIEREIENLLNDDNYKAMSDEKKAEVINDIVNYSYNIAQSDVLGMDLSTTYQKAYNYSKIGDISDYYSFKNSIDDTNKDTKKASITNYLLNSNLKDRELAFLYSNYYSSEEELQEIMTLKIPVKEFIKYNSQEFESDYNENTGKAISNSRKQKVIRFVNSLNLSIPQKAILIKKSYNSYDDYNKQIVNYVNNQSLSKYEKASLLKNIGFDEYDSYIINEVNSKKVSRTEKEKILESMGFKIINGKVYY